MAKKDLKKGIFITFEGCEGCGKSTQSRLLYDHLKAQGYDPVHTREPGGTRLGERVRDILLGSKGLEISDLAEVFLFEAARSQIVEEVIKPALAGRRIVICDRFGDATIAYQGYGGGVELELIKRLNAIAAKGLKPGITILLDIDTATGLRRARAKGVDRMEKKDAAYHKRVRAGYLKLAGAEPARIKVIKVRGTIKMVQMLVRREVERIIHKYTDVHRFHI